MPVARKKTTDWMPEGPGPNCECVLPPAQLSLIIFITFSGRLLPSFYGRNLSRQSTLSSF